MPELDAQAKDRALTCLFACEGMADPVGEIRALRAIADAAAAVRPFIDEGEKKPDMCRACAAVARLDRALAGRKP